MEPGYKIDVIIISAVSCILSIIGGGVIFATFIAIPEIRNFARKLVVCLTVADVISAAAYLFSLFRYSNFVSNNEKHTLCIFQSFCTTYSSIVSFFFTSIIAIYIFDTVTNQRDRLGSTAWLIAFNVISWLIPGSIAVSAGAVHVLGYDTTSTGATGPWCWISTNTTNPVIWMVVAGKGWEIACYLITMSLYVLLKVYLVRFYRRLRFHQFHTSLRDEDKNFLYVWYLLYLLRVWGTIRFLLYAILYPPSEEWYMKVLLHLQAFGDPGQAFFNFFLFCVLDKTVRSKMKRFLNCRKRKEDIEISDPLVSDLDESQNHIHANLAEADAGSAGYGSMTSTSFSVLINAPKQSTNSC